MRRLLPAPLLSVALVALWLVLNPPLSPATVAMAVLVALVVPIVTAPLRPVRARIRRPLVVTKLVLRVGLDILVSNVQVARALLRREGPRSGFATIPLELSDPSGLAALAIITTGVPGTVWIELARDRRTVRLHVFELDDHAAFVRDYKERYERPLREIFE
ncbi:MAG: Na+/H+ antiporter subunit E [Burkholderiales bacterium]|nr:Na+/H+ antiporter subunit E [Burkholderiales bacterium]